MGKRTGVVCMILGVMLIIGSASLLIHNILEDRHAAEASSALLPKVEQAVSEHASGMIDGYEYAGILSIPVLGLELPVLAQWDYTRLMLAPCLYYGSAESSDLVIAAHNFKGHFGRLSQLDVGDKVLFTDMEGNTYEYQVGNMEVLPPAAVEEMIQSQWDLSLYTCTYGGQSRMTVRCQRIF